MNKRLKLNNIDFSLIPMLLLSCIIGTITGALVWSFKFVARFIKNETIIIYTYVDSNPIFIPILFLGLVLIAFIIAFIIKIDPDVKGGGVPRSEGILRGLITFRWLRLFIGTIFSSLLGFLGGLPLGTEGPSVILGLAIGKGTSTTTMLHSKPAMNRYLMTSGASAGFAVATSAPLAGIVFVLEEIHKRFSFIILMVVMSGILFATIASSYLNEICGLTSLYFEMGDIKSLPFDYIWLVLIIGVLSGFLAVLFNQLMFSTGKFFEIKLAKVPRVVKLIATFTLVGISGLLMINSVGGGDRLIINLSNTENIWYLILILLVVKMFLIAISANSGATGGLFVPVIILGGIFGVLLNCIFTKFGMDASYTKAVLCFSMCAFLGATMHAPLTAVIFIIEATGNFDGTLLLITAVFTAVMITNFFSVESLNDVILNKTLRQQDKDKKVNLFEVTGCVEEKAFLIGKSARDILWPANCIIKTMIRKGQVSSDAKMVKGGDKIFKTGDCIIIQTQTYDINQTEIELKELLGEQTFTRKSLN